MPVGRGWFDREPDGLRTPLASQNGQLCAGIFSPKRTPSAVHIGGSRARAVISGIHAARLALQGMSEPSADSRGRGGVESRTLRRARQPVMCGLLLGQRAGFRGSGGWSLALTSSGPGAGGCLGLRYPRTITGKAREGASGFAGRT
jgi:hypothetical protein